jgi:methyl-accepting chemotaxis protein
MNKPVAREGFQHAEPVKAEPVASPAEAPAPPPDDLKETWPIKVKLVHKPIRDQDGRELAELAFREPTAGDINRYGNPVRLTNDFDAAIDERKMTLMKLTVSLVDNATPQLGRIKSAMQGLGSSEAHAAIRHTSEHAKNLGEHIGKLGHDVEHVAKHLLPSFVTGIAGVGTGFLALELATDKTVDSVKEFSKELSQLDRVAKQTGVSAGQVKEMMETFQRGGVDAGQAKQNIAGLAAAMGDLTRVGSELRQKLVKGAGLEHAEEMQRWLVGLSGKDISQFANEVKQKSDEIYQNMVEHQKRLGATSEAAAARAADARKSFLEAFGAPDLIQVMEKFTKMSAE